MMESEEVITQISAKDVWPMAGKILPEKKVETPEGVKTMAQQTSLETKVDLGPEDAYSEFFKGYIDCAKESIEFLTEVERLSSEHPLVVGLQEELHKRLQIVGFKLIIQGLFEAETMNDDESVSNEEEDMGVEENCSTIDPDVNFCAPQIGKLSDDAPFDSADLAASIAEKIYGIFCSEEREDAESEESDGSDNDISLDEGFQSGQE